MNKIENTGNVEAPAPDAVPKKKAPAKVATIYKIVKDGKRTMKKSVSGQVIEALKRAKNPLGLNALAARVFATKVGKSLSVKDNKARVRKCVEWYFNDENGWVVKTEKGEYSLATVEA